MARKNKSISYKVKTEDLERCFTFAVKYRFGVRGGSYDRTTGRYRGLGGIIDSFSSGKLVEIGVARIIEKFTNKKVLLDFEIHGPTEDPDIIKVEEKGKKRDPFLHIEIKHTSEEDRWIGLTEEQFNAILNSNIVKKSGKKAFLVYAQLSLKGSEKDQNLLGAYLKNKIDNNLFNRFCDPEDLEVVLESAFSLKDLKEKGVNFKKGSYMYETNIFRPVSEWTAGRILSSQHKEIYKPIKTSGNTLPIIMRDRERKPKEFGDFKYKGELKVFKKQNEKSDRMYIYCRSEVEITNKIVGSFHLEKGKVYEAFFETLGRDPVLERNNIWIARRNLSRIISKDRKETIKEIAERI